MARRRYSQLRQGQGREAATELTLPIAPAASPAPIALDAPVIKTAKIVSLHPAPTYAVFLDADASCSRTGRMYC